MEEKERKNYSFGKAIFYSPFSLFSHVLLPSLIAVPAYIGCLGLGEVILFFFFLILRI